MRRTAALTIAVLVVAIVAVLAIVRPFGRAASSIETATVTRGTLEATVELAGTLEPAETRILTFGTSGTIASVTATVGQKVAPGDLLATLDDTIVNAQVRAAETALTSAQARLAADRGGLTSAQLTQAKDPVTQAQAALTSALTGQKAAESQRTTTVGAAQATLDQARAKLAADTDAGAADPILTLDNLAVRTAEANLTSVRAQADAAVSQAGAAVSSARSALTAAQHAYTVRTAPAPDALIAADEAAVASAELSLATARQTLALATIASPIGGTVTEVGYRVGERTGGLGSTGAGSTGSGSSLGGGALGGAALGGSGGSGRIVVEDLSSLRVTASASEIDVVSLSIGQKASLTLDAIPDLAIAAQICELGATGSTDQGVVEYPVTMCIATPDPRVRTGMSANVSIVLARRENVLIVPTPAIRTVDGKTVARVVRTDGTVAEVPVVTGVSSGTRIEIVSGLAEGDQVAVGATPSAATR